MDIKVGNTSVTNFKVSNTNVREIRLGNIKIWPSVYTYEIISISISYSQSVSYILANGSNYASATGTVDRYLNGVYVDTLYNQTLIPISVTDVNNFNIDSSNNTITGNHLHQREVTNSTSSTWQYQTATTTATIYQQTNSKSKVYNSATAYISINDAPASGCATAATTRALAQSLTYSTSYYYQYTSGDSSSSTPESGTCTSVSYSGGSAISSKGTTPSSRTNTYVTITGSGYYPGGYCSTSGYVYQAANSVISSYYTYGDREIKRQESYNSNYTSSISSNRYSSSSSACPASGSGSSIASLTAVGQHTVTTTTYYKKPRYNNDLYSSGSVATSFDTYVDDGSGSSSSTASDNVTVTSSGTSGFNFNSSNRTVSIDSEGTTEYLSGRSCTFTVNNSGVTNTVTLYQASNTSSYSRTEWSGIKEYSTPTETNYDYRVSLYSSRFTSDDDNAMLYLGGSYNVLSYSASHTHKVSTPWTEGGTNYYTWSSGSESTSSVSRQGTDDTISYHTDTPTLRVTQGSSYCSVSGTTVIFSENTNTSSSRFAVVTATNGTASNGRSIYQRKKNFSQVVSLVGVVSGGSGIIYVRNTYQQALSVNATVTTRQPDGAAIVTRTSTVTANTSGVEGTAQDTPWGLGYPPTGSFEYTINSVTKV